MANFALRGVRALLILSTLLGSPSNGVAPEDDEYTVIIRLERVDYMTRDDVYEMCKRIAPQFGFDPLLLLAQIEQESTYRENAVRMEPMFHGIYTRPLALNPTVEILLASSYGLGQLMGLSLSELEYFPSLDSVAVIRTLDDYLRSPEEQITTMCLWLKRKQDLGTSHTITDALRRYNGSASYPALVFARHDTLKGIYEKPTAAAQ